MYIDKYINPSDINIDTYIYTKDILKIMVKILKIDFLENKVLYEKILLNIFDLQLGTK